MERICEMCGMVMPRGSGYVRDDIANHSRICQKVGPDRCDRCGCRGHFSKSLFANFGEICPKCETPLLRHEDSETEPVVQSQESGYNDSRQSAEKVEDSRTSTSSTQSEPTKPKDDKKKRTAPKMSWSA